MKYKAIGNLVALRNCDLPIEGGRQGTVDASKDEIAAIFGPPQDYPCDDKVTYRWLFETPRGFVEVRDYWWNGPREHSIGSTNMKATQYLVHFLRSKGLTATYGRRFAPPPAPIR